MNILYIKLSTAVVDKLGSCPFVDQLFLCKPLSLPVERGSSVVERRTRNQVSPGSNPPLLPFRRLGIFVLSIDAPVDSAV